MKRVLRDRLLAELPKFPKAQGTMRSVKFDGGCFYCVQGVVLELSGLGYWHPVNKSAYYFNEPIPTKDDGVIKSVAGYICETEICDRLGLTPAEALLLRDANDLKHTDDGQFEWGPVIETINSFQVTD